MLRRIVGETTGGEFFESPAMLVVETDVDKATLERAVARVVRWSQGDRLIAVDSGDAEAWKRLEVLRSSFLAGK